MREKIKLMCMDYFEAIKRNQARNNGRFAVGTVFRGDINGALMEIVKLQPNYSKTRTIAVIKDLKTGKLHNHGLLKYISTGGVVMVTKSDLLAAVRNTGVTANA